MNGRASILTSDEATPPKWDEHIIEGVDERFFPFGLGCVRSVKMELLDVERQQREIGVVDIEDGAAGSMLEHVAGLEVLIVEPRCFAVAPFADGFVGGQHGFHWIVSLLAWEIVLSVKLG